MVSVYMIEYMRLQTTPVSFRHDITEMLLKVVLNTINQINIDPCYLFRLSSNYCEFIIIRGVRIFVDLVDSI